MNTQPDIRDHTYNNGRLYTIFNNNGIAGNFFDFDDGYENRNTELADDRARNIYFANLPNRCAISIYSIDGDLVRKIEHDEPTGNATASTERFSMITRNTQALVSGLYYWAIVSEYGTQIGKLVVIK